MNKGKRGHHRTTDKVLERSLLWLESLSVVERVVIHRVENCRHKYSPGMLRVRRSSIGGLMLSGYMGRGIADIFVHISVDNVAEFNLLMKKKGHEPLSVD
jgi:hypothetical protein